MTTDEIKALVIAKANQYGINSNVALVQLARESANFRQDVVFGPFVGGAGERGISQFTPGTWQRFGSGPHTNAYDPNLALDAWGNYMNYLLGLFGGAYLETLIAYNGGEGHLLNPSQYGPPSAAAKSYGREILSQAGLSADSGADIGPIVVTPGGFESVPDWLKWAAIGGVALLIWTAVSD